jgi:SAM-dependent methyltransferase
MNDHTLQLRSTRPVGHHKLPHWLIGYLFLLPLRRLWENPRDILAPWITPGATVLELGPGMGYFSLDLGHLIGADGRLVCAEIQPRMLEVLQRRVDKAGLTDRVDIRRATPDDPNLEDLVEAVDFAFLHNVLHEVADPARVVGKICRALKPGGRLYLTEPVGHVSGELYAWEVRLAQEAGLVLETEPRQWHQMTAVLRKP